MNLAAKLTRYKAWANKRTITYLLGLPEGEVERPRSTHFGSILHTLQHSYIVDDIFRAHLLAKPHGYSRRWRDTSPPLPDFWKDVQAMDAWWVQTADQWDEETLNKPIAFKFLDGKDGRMSPIEMVMHVVNHTSYHRGFVDEILGQMGMDSPASDFPVFLRESTTETE
jgi:uncharacterized damage-inducible protein DinB